MYLSTSSHKPVDGLLVANTTLLVGWCRESNDFLLPAMITFLNDRDWQLRAAFFHHICEMGAYAGTEGLQAFLLPCLEQVSLLLLTGLPKRPFLHRTVAWTV